ncbi:MAG: hypothetical protein ACE5GB_10230 [Acidimicrobiales bacterium]
MVVLVALLALAVGALTVLVFGLLRTHADILRALHRAGISLDDDGDATVDARRAPTAAVGPGGRQDAADIVGTVPGGGAVKVSVLGLPQPTLLAFLSSGCRTCEVFWEAFADPDLVLPGHDTRLVIVAQDPAHDSESRLTALAPGGVRTVCSSSAWQSYEVPGSPYFVLVDGATAAVIGSGSATSWGQVSGLLEQALGDAGLEARGRPSGRRRGSSAGRPGQRGPIRRCWPPASGRVIRACGPRSTPARPSPSPREQHAPARSRRGGLRCGPFDLVTLRRVDAHEHQPAR